MRIMLSSPSKALLLLAAAAVPSIVHTQSTDLPVVAPRTPAPFSLAPVVSPTPSPIGFVTSPTPSPICLSSPTPSPIIAEADDESSSSPAPSSRRVASNSPTARGSFKPTSCPSSSGKSGKNGSTGKDGSGKNGSSSSSTSSGSRNASLKSSKSSKNSSNSNGENRNADLAMLSSEYAFVSSSPAPATTSSYSSFLGISALSLVAAVGGAAFFLG